MTECVRSLPSMIENPNTHQRNLHCHIMLTMRPILEDGSWGDKQKEDLCTDADGNKIRKRMGNDETHSRRCDL